jgi:hypothetical protein
VSDESVKEILALAAEAAAFDYENCDPPVASVLRSLAYYINEPERARARIELRKNFKPIRRA